MGKVQSTVMPVTLLRVVSPCLEVSNCSGFLDSFRDVKLFDPSKFIPRDSSSIGGKRDKRRRWRFCSLSTHLKYSCVGHTGIESASNLPLLSNVLASPAGEMAVSSEQKVYEVVLKQASLVKRKLTPVGDIDVKPDIPLPGNLGLLSEAYDRCGEVCAEYAKTFYLG